MEIDKKIILELKRFNEINRYINEQDAAEPPAPPTEEPIEEPGAGATPPTEPTEPPAGEPTTPPAGEPTTPPAGEPTPEPIDVENDPDVEEVKDDETDTGADEDTEEIDITDLIKTQEEIKTGQEEFMDNIFSKIDDLANKLQHMDQIMDRINSLENKFDKYREKTPEEKLMLRSLDSYPYNQKLTDFFDDKKEEMEETGKNEYVLTSDEVEEFSPNEIKKTFNTFDEEEEKLSESYRRRNRRLL